MAMVIGNIRPRRNKLKARVLPRNSMRANTKAARLQMTTTPTVVATITTRLLRNMTQNTGPVTILTKFSQCGGTGIVYGDDIASPRVLSAANTSMTTGTTTITNTIV